jgi:hypothetical protein
MLYLVFISVLGFKRIAPLIETGTAIGAQLFVFDHGDQNQRRIKVRIIGWSLRQGRFCKKSKRIIAHKLDIYYRYVYFLKCAKNEFFHPSTGICYDAVVHSYKMPILTLSVQFFSFLHARVCR